MDACERVRGRGDDDAGGVVRAEGHYREVVWGVHADDTDASTL